jgi:hypothetical protein
MISNYHAYLLRLWERKDLIGGKWFMSLEDPTSHEKLFFNTFEDLFCFIHSISDKGENQTADMEEPWISAENNQDIDP